MCDTCRDQFAALEKFLADHAVQCKRADCPITHSTAQSGMWWWMATAHARLRSVQQRMNAVRAVTDRPEDVPAQFLLDWEDHCMAAAQDLARARREREEVESAQRMLQQGKLS